jgi:hypothetical protein
MTHCVICGEKMSAIETEARPHNVCFKCFWEEEKKQRTKKYVHRFDLLASSVPNKQRTEIEK